MDKEIFIDDIPVTKDDISIVGMDKVKIASRDELKYKKLETEIEKLKQENNELRKLDESNSNNIEKSQKQLAKIETTKNPYKEDDNTYILCSFDNKEMTYIFNAVKKTFRLVNKLDTVSYTVSFNEAYIVASNEALELTINRVSGKATYENKTLNKGLCELTDQTKF
jgi:seryl-tRNA synthetase